MQGVQTEEMGKCEKGAAGKTRPGRCGRRKQRNAGSVSGLVSDTENKCKFFDAKRKPVERSKRPISPSEFDYIFICAFLKRGSEEEEGMGGLEGMV